VSLTFDTVVPAQVTAATAADTAGDRRAGHRVVAAVRPSVVRYCRARLGRGARAAAVARVVCRTIADTLPDTADEATITAFVYRTAAAAVDAEAANLAGLPAQLARLPRHLREVLVLRVVVGLSLEQAAAALGATPDAVRQVQHHALQQLRAA
jgi:RNA polymerase sigma-70 factor (ECF subfamily)